MKRTVIAVIGLGYVGLPLAITFSRAEFEVYGFDTSQNRINELKRGLDSSGELPPAEIAAGQVNYTTDESDLDQANFFVVAVPTPVNKDNEPDMELLVKASQLIGRHLKPNDIVVYESTVYPGATEEICQPVLEKVSGLTLGKDFGIGYSPERINPGDKNHTLANVVKIVAGHDDATASRVAAVYEQVCPAGLHKAKNIKTAEAAKVVENIQRDVNIALANELSNIFEPLGIITKDVMEAAGTKWNFAVYSPGLVGGHCIGVDPYYLIAKAKSIGYQPNLLMTARQVNDQVAKRITDTLFDNLKKTHSTILVAGLTFKENVRDVRNSQISRSINDLIAKGHQIFGYDPLLTEKEITTNFGIPAATDLNGQYDALIISAPHRQIVEQVEQWRKLAQKADLIFDIKRALPELQSVDGPTYYSL